jgi:hypothetical protein
MSLHGIFANGVNEFFLDRSGLLLVLDKSLDWSLLEIGEGLSRSIPY